MKVIINEIDTRKLSQEYRERDMGKPKRVMSEERMEELGHTYFDSEQDPIYICGHCEELVEFQGQEGIAVCLECETLEDYDELYQDGSVY